MCQFHDSNGNGFGDIWWTDNSSILVVEMSLKISPGGKNQSGRTIIVAVLYDVSLPFHPYQVTPLELGEDWYLG